MDYRNNAYSRPWIVVDGTPNYMYGVGVFRIFTDVMSARLILKGYVHETYEFYDIMNIPNGSQIELQHGTHGNPSIYRVGDTWMRFENCKKSRMWISRPCALTPDEADATIAYVELVSDSWQIMRITRDDFTASVHAPVSPVHQE